MPARNPHVSAATTADGIPLRTLHWPSEGTARAAAVLVHGLGEHAGRYEEVAEPLARAGIDVDAFDLRGFGASGGRRAFVERWEVFHDDLGERVRATRAAHPDLPLVLYGHSMGGLIALGYVLSEHPHPLPDALVLSAPGIDSTHPATTRVVAAVLDRVVPTLRIRNGLPSDGLSRDDRVRVAAAADPLCQSASTVRLGAAAFREQRRVRAAIARLDALRVPTYVLHGSADSIVPVAATEVLGLKGNVTRRVHEGLRHECHHEPEHEAVLAEVVAWLRPILGVDSLDNRRVASGERAQR